MTSEEILESLKILINNLPNVSCTEYWERINKIAEKERIAFEEENKKLAMSNNDFNRCFTI